MTGGRSELGDLLRAVQLLEANADDASRLAIAEVLGLTVARQALTSEQPPESRRPEISPGPAQRASIHDETPRTNQIPATIRYLDEPLATAPPSWFQTVTPLPVQTVEYRTIPAKPSLLTPVWTRALLTAALTTICESGEIDMDRLIDTLSRGEPVDVLPVIRVPTLARGVHCWIDQGPAMQPFLQDQRQLLAELASVVGISRVTVHRFQGVPGREGNFVQRAPHLLLSDLSFTPLPDDYVPEPVFVRDWMDFAAWLATDLQALPVALTPLPVTLYPPSLRRKIPILCWDRGTSVQNARRALTGAL